jgi:hypothetical protein
MSVVCIACCQVEVSVTSCSLVQRSPTDYGASLCVITKPRERGGHSPRWDVEAEKKNYFIQEDRKLNLQNNCLILSIMGVFLR